MNVVECGHIPTASVRSMAPLAGLKCDLIQSDFGGAVMSECRWLFSQVLR